MPSIFLSHNRKDKPFARKFADSLTNKGIYVWIDEAKLNIGNHIGLSVSESNALYSRYLNFYDEFVAKTKEIGGDCSVPNERKLKNGRTNQCLSCSN